MNLPKQKVIYGELQLGGIIHSPVWTVGISWMYELDKQGFFCVSCPPNFNVKKRTQFDKRLRVSKQAYPNVFKEKYFIKSEISDLDILFDDQQEFTKEPNILAIQITKKDKVAPLGWIVHKKTSEILPQEITEDIIHVSAIA